MGVISAHDMTTEAALAKLMMLLGQKMDNQQVREGFDRSFCGEVTV
jgi:L-asparaginase